MKNDASSFACTSLYPFFFSGNTTSKAPVSELGTIQFYACTVLVHLVSDRNLDWPSKLPNRTTLSD